MLAQSLYVATLRVAFAPRRRRIKTSRAGIPVEAIWLKSSSGARIAGWFAAGVPGRGAVVLLHGITDNRLKMIPRLRFLNAAGFAVLAIDFQAHGMSSGRAITLGGLELLDAAAAVEYLRAHLPEEKVGAIGISLGGAAALVGDQPLDVDALALESVYPDIRRATVNRFAFFLGRFGEPLADLVIAHGQAALGVDPEKLRPVKAISRVRAPIFVLAGDRDPWTPIHETREMFDSAEASKRLWEAPGAGHVDLYDHAPEEYRRRMLEFLSSTLSAEGR